MDVRLLTFLTPVLVVVSFKIRSLLPPSSPSSAVKMETVCFSDALVSTYESTRRHNPEEVHRRENLKSHNANTRRKEFVSAKFEWSFIEL
jgi:hypothetical protein